MNYPRNLEGIKFGRLTILNRVNKPEHLKTNNTTYWFCICECGNTRVIPRTNLVKGNTTSCGCLNKEIVSNQMKETLTTHNMSRTRFYAIWRNMKYRCNNPNCHTYMDYGGRGIVICERWNKFENFFEDMYDSYQKHVGEYGEKQTTLDRRDNNGNYEPNNCRWATYSEQVSNQRKRRS